MAPKTTPTKKAIICTMKKAGASHNDIRAALTGRHDLTDRSINRIFKRYAESEDYYNVGKSTGRPRKLMAEDSRLSVELLANGTARNATELQQKFFSQVHVHTIKRDLRRSGLEPHHRTDVPYAPPQNIDGRKEWADHHLRWTKRNWRAVTFSDESIFRVFGSNGLEWCWRKPGERFDRRFTKKKVKHGGGKVTVWGMITSHGVGRIVRIEGNLTGVLYREILEDDALGTFSDLGLDPSDYYFQHDNDPKHTAKIVKEWFTEKGIDLLDWPPNSPDISIIENLWDYLDHQIRKRNPLPTSEATLWEALQEEWYKIPNDYIASLYQSLPDRVAALVSAEGNATRY